MQAYGSGGFLKPFMCVTDIMYQWYTWRRCYHLPVSKYHT